MIESIANLLLKNGVTGGLIFVGVVLFWKTNPITLFTASYTERKLLTKEKRLYIKILHIISYLLLGILVFLIVFAAAAVKNNTYFKVISFIGYIIIMMGVIIISILSANPDRARKKWSKYNAIPKIIVVISCIAYVTSIYTVLPFHAGSLFSLSPEKITSEFVIGLLIVAVFSSSLSLLLINLFFKYLSMLTETKQLFINIHSCKWYVLHAIDNYFLLSNHPDHNNATVFRYITREELFKENINIEEVKFNGYEISDKEINEIEYSI
jgi:hypothetical protein